MKFNPEKFAIRLLSVIFCILLLAMQPSRAGVTINFDIGEITTAGTLVSPGTFLFISHGGDNVFNSNTWLSGSSFVLGDDILIGAFGIVDGRVANAITNLEIALGQGSYGTTKFTGVFISGLTGADVNYATGQLLGGNSFASSGGISYQFGTYRTDSIEGYGQGPVGNMGWIIPSDGATLALNAGTNTNLRGDGFFLGPDISASLATTSSFAVIPEPSSMSLMVMGLASVLAFRRKALVKREKCV